MPDKQDTPAVPTPEHWNCALPIPHDGPCTPAPPAEALDKAVAATPSLDVERLHKAADHMNVAHQRWVWDKIAAEYARLSPDSDR